MKISEANVLMTDLVAARQQDAAHALDVFHQMLKETQVGQAWGVLVPTEFLDQAELPNGLKAEPLVPGGTAITGVVRAPKHILAHALRGCYCDGKDIMSCVICGKPRGVPGVVTWQEWEHTDTCSETCFRRLEKQQRKSWGVDQ